VYAAPEFSVEAKSWWYPFVGTAKYRGFFDERMAREKAAELKRQGYDVYVGGVRVYSTLGWFPDPVLNTFIGDEPSGLAETVLHELTHARVFIRGDSDFNEAFATTVGQEGSRRWLVKKGDQEALAAYRAERQRTRDFVALISRTREKLEKLYGDERTPEGKLKAARKRPITDVEELRRRKREIFAELQKDYAALKQSWGGNAEYDQWFAAAINNAQLNSVATYYDLVPGFERLLALNGGDMEKFYNEVERLSKMPKKERHQWLETLRAGGEVQKVTAEKR
jgi:predicted aminopeptidase